MIIIRYCKIKIKKVIGTEKEENTVCFCYGKLGRWRIIFIKPDQWN